MPARVVHRNFAVRFAARQVEGGDLAGSWRVYASTDPGLQTWTVKIFPTLLADEAREDPDPIPFRDFSPFFAELDDAATHRERESWHPSPVGWHSTSRRESLPEFAYRRCGPGFR